MRKPQCLPVILLLAALVPVTPASAETIKQTKEEIRTKCNAAGGELLGISEFGSYGCEGKNGGMVLCNKNSDCTIYLPSQARPGISVEDALNPEFWRAEQRTADPGEQDFPIGLAGLLGLLGLLGLRRTARMQNSGR